MTPTILTLDLGTSTTKAGLWECDGLLSMGRVPLRTHYGDCGRVEQDPGDWWPSVVDATKFALAAAPSVKHVDAIVMTAARQSFVPADDDVRPIGMSLLWSDRRASPEAASLAASCGGLDAVARRTGMMLDGASVAGKLAWIASHEPWRMERAKWVLSPRDLILHRLTGVIATDTTLASATGLYDTQGDPVRELAGPAVGKLPEVVPPATVVGGLCADGARSLGLRVDTPVVIGAGDRPSEVLGAGASSDRAMVSWGTTANVSVPVEEIPDFGGSGLVCTRGAVGGWLLEGGLSAAGSLVAWLENLTGRKTEELMGLAAESPPGARGVVATPWAGGARAPWWRDGARASLTGLSLEHGPGDITRAVLESVAWDIDRCLRPCARVASLAVGGAGARSALWVEILASVTGLAATVRRSGEAASAGAALVASAALGAALDLERIDPVVERIGPSERASAFYSKMRPVVDDVASTLIELGTRPRP